MSSGKTLKGAHSFGMLISEFGKEQAAHVINAPSSLFQKMLRKVAEFARFSVGIIVKRILLNQE